MESTVIMKIEEYMKWVDMTAFRMLFSWKQNYFGTF